MRRSELKVRSDYPGRRAPRAVKVVLGALLAVGIPLSYEQGLRQGRETRDARKSMAEVLRTYETRPLRAFVPLEPNHPFVVPLLASQLQRLEYNVFAEP